MTLVFLDTVGLIALWDQSDQWHVAAEQAMATLNVPSSRLVTTSLILFECGNAAARKPYRTDVDELWRKMATTSRLIVPTESDIEKAWIEYRRGRAGDAGIVDHVSFAVMNRLGITDAFTNDCHFRTAGFNTLF